MTWNPASRRDRPGPRRRRWTRGRRVRSGGSRSRRRSFDGDIRRPDGDGLGDTDSSATGRDRLRHVRWERVERRVGLGRPLPGLARPRRVAFRHVARAGGHTAGGHGGDGRPPRRPDTPGSPSGRDHGHSGGHTPPRPHGLEGRRDRRPELRVRVRRWLGLDVRPGSPRSRAPSTSSRP